MGREISGVPICTGMAMMRFSSPGLPLIQIKKYTRNASRADYSFKILKFIDIL